jgi:hypothetical protein
MIVTSCSLYTAADSAALMKPVLRIRIRKIHMFLGLTDPDPDPLVRDTDPNADPSIIKQNSKKNIDIYCFVTSLLLFIFEK